MSDAVREVVVKATPDTIFPYLSDPDLMVQWLGSSVCLDPRVGGELHVVCGGNPGVGQFTEIVPNERVAFSFGWSEPDHPIPPGSTQVEISLTAEGDTTVVRLIHHGLPEDAVSDHEGGWGHYLERLAQVLDGETPTPERSDGSNA